MSDNVILLTAFSAPDEALANRALLQLKNLASTQGTVLRSPSPKPYWKIKEHWELFIALHPARPILDVFDTLLSELGSGWKIHRFTTNGSWALWNPGANSMFIDSSIQWAHLECVRNDDTE